MSELKELNQQAFRIGMTSNGIALTLSVAAYSRLGGTEVEISKFPIWCFFIGLIIGGIIIFFKMTAITIETHKDIVERLDNIEKLINESAHQQVHFEQGVATLRKSISEETSKEIIEMTGKLEISLGETSCRQTRIEKKVADLRQRVSNPEDEVNKDIQKWLQITPSISKKLRMFIEILLLFQYILFLIGAASAIGSL